MLRELNTCYNIVTALSYDSTFLVEKSLEHIAGAIDLKLFQFLSSTCQVLSMGW